VLNEAGQLRETFTRGVGLAGDIGTLVAVTHHAGSTTNGVFYAHHNHRGDVVRTRSGTSTTGVYDYGAFGGVKAQTGADVCRFKFSSKEREASCNFYYYGFRFYAPQWQRWPNPDPIGERGGFNLYSFVKNHVTTKVDPLGLSLWDDDDDPYVWIKDKDGNLIPYSAACLANAKKNSIDCLKGVGESAALGLAICVVGCLPALTFGPPGYYICVTACLGLDAAVTLYGIAACLDEYNKAKEACRPCKNPNDGSWLR